jgi:CBS domain-containing protein
MMKKARDVMTKDAQCIGATETLAKAARQMLELDVGALPICGEDNRLAGIVTDRDIVLKVVAEDKDLRTTKALEIASGRELVTIGADDSVEEAMRTMIDHKVRRLPVIDGRDLVGMVSMGDLATALDEKDAGQLLEAISAAP